MTCFLRTGPLPKRQGEVKWFNPRKRHGFIADQDGQDIFIHQKQILAGNSNALQEGQKVRSTCIIPPKDQRRGTWNARKARHPR
jgi:CspA family cold shock protein